MTLYSILHMWMSQSIVIDLSIAKKGANGENIHLKDWNKKNDSFNTHCMRLVSSIIIVGRSPWIGLFCVYNPLKIEKPFLSSQR